MVVSHGAAAPSLARPLALAGLTAALTCATACATGPAPVQASLGGGSWWSKLMVERPSSAARSAQGAATAKSGPLDDQDQRVASLANGADRRTPATTVSFEKPAYGTVEHVGSRDFQEKVLKNEGPVVVDFYADWCGPCQRLGPILADFASENPHTRVVKVNIDHSPDLRARYGVTSIPALRVFEDGQVTQRHVGVVSKTTLTRWVAN